MNKTIIFVSCVVSIVLLHFGMSAKQQSDDLKTAYVQLRDNNLDMEQKIWTKGFLPRSVPVVLSTAYGALINQMRLLESTSGTSMKFQLEGAKDTDDISSHYVDTPYKGIKGLKIKIVVDKFAQETDMGAVLDDIYLLERNTDFMASEIYKDNNNLIVKGEVYGL